MRCHEGDVLCLCKGSVHQSRAIFASGTDSKIVAVVDQEGDWIVKNSWRKHTHDVKTLAATDSFIVTGGVDTNVYIAQIEPVFFKGSEQIQQLTPYPSREIIHATANESFLFQSTYHLELWELTDSISFFFFIYFSSKWYPSYFPWRFHSILINFS